MVRPLPAKRISSPPERMPSRPSSWELQRRKDAGAIRPSASTSARSITRRTARNTVTVTTESDELGTDGLRCPGSLRAVVSDPALCIGATVTFAGDYTISPRTVSGWLGTFDYIIVSRAITIDGSGHDVTFSGENGALYLAGSQWTVPLVLKNVTVANAGCPISVMGNVTISNVDFSNNTCGNGGAIRNAGTLTVLDSTFSGNTADASNVPNEGDGGGGAIYNATAAHLTVSGSTFVDNEATYGPGGAINNYEHELTVTNSTFSGNSAYLFGGAISNYNPVATLSVTNSTFAGNTVTGPADSPYLEAPASITVGLARFATASSRATRRRQLQVCGSGHGLEQPGGRRLLREYLRVHRLRGVCGKDSRRDQPGRAGRTTAAARRQSHCCLAVRRSTRATMPPAPRPTSAA